MKHLVNRVQSLSERQIGFKVITEQGANIDTSTPSVKLVFGIFAFAALTAFEGEFIRERTLAGLTSASARGRKGGRKS